MEVDDTYTVYPNEVLTNVKIPYEFRFERSIQQMQVIIKQYNGTEFNQIYEFTSLAPAIGQININSNGQEVNLQAGTYQLEAVLFTKRFGVLQEIPSLRRIYTFVIIEI